jgi:hypothetical protein
LGSSHLEQLAVVSMLSEPSHDSASPRHQTR